MRKHKGLIMMRKSLDSDAVDFGTRSFDLDVVDFRANERRKGFTIIEVMLVLAVGGLLMVGLMVGFSSSVARQRYNDTVQDFAEYLRTVYSEVESPEGTSTTGGTSNYAFYGKVIFVGPKRDGAYVYDYSAYGSAALSSEGGSTLDALMNDSKFYIDHESGSGHTILWSGNLENAAGNTFTGIIIILRSPIDNVVHTYWRSASISSVNSSQIMITTESGGWYRFGINTIFSNPADGHSDTMRHWFAEAVLYGATTKEVDFCIDSDDLSAAGGTRRDVRLAADGHNSTAVQLIDVDSEDNVCR